MTHSPTAEAPEPGKYASEAIDRKLAEWRNAPSVAPVPLELHLLRTSIADFVDRERIVHGYAAAHATLSAIVAELPSPSTAEADEAAVSELSAALGGEDDEEVDE